MSNVDTRFIVQTNVTINTAITSPASFNNCMIAGVFNTAPSSWSGAVYKLYYDLASIEADFEPLITGTTLQDNRYQWLINACTRFFAQQPTPISLVIGKIPVPAFGVAFNYSTALQAIATAYNTWIPFSVADELSLTNSATSSPSTLVVTIDVTVGSAQTLPANWEVSGSVSPSPAYKTTGTTSIPSSGTYNITLYSNDVTTAVPAGAMDSGDAVSGITFNSITNVSPAVLGSAQTPGFKGSGGLVEALVTFRATNSNDKVCFQDTVDTSIAGSLQTAGGDSQLAIFNHSLNFLPEAGGSEDVCSLAAANLQNYFGNIYSFGVGQKIIANTQLNGDIFDPAVTTSNYRTLIDANNNVYVNFGSGSGTNLMEFGYVSSSTSGNKRYVDQTVGALYVKSITQTYLFNTIVAAGPQGIPYSDSGIQQLVTSYKSALQNCVDQKILQPLQNNQVTYLTYAQVQAQHEGSIAARDYSFLAYNGKFLSRIQTLTNNVNLTI